VRDTPGATGKLAATVAATISVVLRPTFTYAHAVVVLAIWI
jgi:hypothetical protein